MTQAGSRTFSARESAWPARKWCQVIEKLAPIDPLLGVHAVTLAALNEQWQHRAQSGHVADVIFDPPTALVSVCGIDVITATPQARVIGPCKPIAAIKLYRTHATIRRCHQIIQHKPLVFNLLGNGIGGGKPDKRLAPNRSPPRAMPFPQGVISCSLRRPSRGSSRSLKS